MDEGFIKIHRKIMQWAWYKDESVARVFIHLLLIANHKDNAWRNIVIKRGQLVTSYRHLAEDLNIGVATVHRAVKKLISTGEITTERNAKFTIITLINYTRYQQGGTIAERKRNNSGTIAESNKKYNITSNIIPKNEKEEKKAPPSANETPEGGWKSRRDF